MGVVARWIGKSKKDVFFAAIEDTSPVNHANGIQS
jgi:hypothetical protein